MHNFNKDSANICNMRTILQILIGLVVLTGCSARQDSNKQSVNTTVVKQEIASTNQQSVQSNNKNIDSSKVETPRYFKDPLRNLNDFTINTNYPAFDKFIDDLSNNKNVVKTIKTDFCWGDCCGSYEKLVDSTRKVTLFLCKVNCFEYSFGNDQFLIVNDTLSMVRNYSCGVYDFRTESISPSFEMKEKLFIFDKDKVTIKERKKILRGDENYTLSDIDFKVTEGDRAALLKEKTEELKNKIHFADSSKTGN
jgi:hypothetical protein